MKSKKLNKEQRTAFLRTKTWGAFRKQLLKERGAMCALCGQRYYGKNIKTLHCHHLDPSDYTNLDPQKFAILCKPCHKYWHRILRRHSGKHPLINLSIWDAICKAITPKNPNTVNPLGF